MISEEGNREDNIKSLNRKSCPWWEFTCEQCNMTMKIQDKKNHLLSKKHRQNQERSQLNPPLVKKTIEVVTENNNKTPSYMHHTKLSELVRVIGGIHKGKEGYLKRQSGGKPLINKDKKYAVHVRQSKVSFTTLWIKGEFLYITKKAIFKSGNIGLELEGNKIIQVVPKSQADVERIRKGWIVAEVNGKPQPNDEVAIVNAINQCNKRGLLVTILFKGVCVDRASGESNLNEVILAIKDIIRKTPSAEPFAIANICKARGYFISLGTIRNLIDQHRSVSKRLLSSKRVLTLKHQQKQPHHFQKKKHQQKQPRNFQKKDYHCKCCDKDMPAQRKMSHERSWDHKKKYEKFLIQKVKENRQKKQQKRRKLQDARLEEMLMRAQNYKTVENPCTASS